MAVKVWLSRNNWCVIIVLLLVFQALSKEDLANLKSCLQKVKKHREQMPNVTSVVPAPAPSADPSALKAQLAQAKELVAKVQRRKERPGDQSQQQDAGARDR